MTPLMALWLGIVQGLTEFLPVSSSGHLQLFQSFFGDQQGDLFFDLVCHGGTLIAILCLLWKDLWTALCDPKQRALLALGTLPLFGVVLLKPHIEALYGVPLALAICFLITGALLFAGDTFARTAPTKRWHGLAIGIMQAIAVLPGISRSGSTISSAQLLGWDRIRAIRFSFLLAIPAVSGGICLQLLHSPVPALSFNCYLIGFATSLLMGFVAFFLLMKLVARWGLRPFATYCALLGIVCLIKLSAIPS